MQQELTERRPISTLQLGGVVLLALWLTYLGRGVFAYAPVNFVFWVVAGTLALYAIQLAFAQIRSHAQPFDHTLVITEDELVRTDNMRRRSESFGWQDVRRLRISPEAFEFSFRQNRQGETYLLNRAKLSAEENRFIAERLIAL